MYIIILLQVGYQPSHLFGRVGGLARRHSLPDLRHLVRKHLPVLRTLNGRDRRAQHVNFVLSQHAAPTQLDAAVQSRLTSEGQQDAVGTFRFDDLQQVT